MNTQLRVSKRLDIKLNPKGTYHMGFDERNLSLGF